MLRGEFRRWMLEDRGFAASTRRSYSEKTEQANRYMKATFGRRLVMAQEEHLRAYLGTFPWPKTRNVHRTALRSYFRFARERGYRTTDPIGNIERMREPRYLPRPLSVEQVKRLRAAAATLSLRHRVIVDLALFAGPRRSEIASLRWADVDLASMRIRFFGKQKEGVIPLHHVLAAELQLWRLTIPTQEWVFPSSTGQRGRHLSGGSIWVAIKAGGAGVVVVDWMVGRTDCLGAAWPHAVRMQTASAGTIRFTGLPALCSQPIEEINGGPGGKTE